MTNTVKVKIRNGQLNKYLTGSLSNYGNIYEFPDEFTIEIPVQQIEDPKVFLETLAGKPRRRKYRIVGVDPYEYLTGKGVIELEEIE